MTDPGLEVYTASEAAKILRMSVWTLRDKAREGLIPHHKDDGGRIKITRANLDEYLRRTAQPTKEGTQP